jgi:hypothetical protein
MRNRIRINTHARSDENTGFGTNGSLSGGRFLNPDGSPNVIKRGAGILSRYSLYHTFLAMPRWKFLFVLLCIYIVINVFFAIIYYLIGMNSLVGVSIGSPMQNFAEAFFFSAQTFTTVGYGRISPTGFLASSIAAMEAFTGLLSFAIATGLFYGRFARPTAFLKFSDIAVVAPYRGIQALMFRMAPRKNNNLLEAEAKVTLAMKLDENGKLNNKFFGLNLELARVNSLTASWTVVHPIDEKSPLFNLDHQEYKNLFVELLIYVKAFDDTYSNTVTAVKSYVANEIVFGAKFKLMFHPSEDGKRTILSLDKINEIENAPLPAIISDEAAAEAQNN